MKILYGVQGTGNGHISRASAIGAALEEHADVDVTWLFSGRRKEDLFGVADNFLWRRGMTFYTENGSVKYLKTMLTNNLWQFSKEVRSLALDQYDDIIVDFEPVVGWASKLRGRKTVGIGHQYAFTFDIPMAGDNFISKLILRNFGPATESLGLHWHHFDYPILPPVVDLDGFERKDVVNNKVVVYLSFENQEKVIRILRNIPSHEFYVYAPGLTHADTCNVHTRPPSKEGFKQDLVTSSHVICNTGFELLSECFTLGIRVLTKPLAQQMEQLSNALALEQLGYARVIYEIDENVIGDWLQQDDYVEITYPRVHEQIADWLVGGRKTPIEDLCRSAWDKVSVRRGSLSQAPKQTSPATSCKTP